MKTVYSEEDQKNIDLADFVIQEHEKRLLQALKAQTGDEREIRQMFFDDRHRQMLIKSKADMMSVMVTSFVMDIKEFENIPNTSEGKNSK